MSLACIARWQGFIQALMAGVAVDSKFQSFLCISMTKLQSQVKAYWKVSTTAAYTRMTNLLTEAVVNTVNVSLQTQSSRPIIDWAFLANHLIQTELRIATTKIT